MNRSNLIPNSKRSPEELREMGRKGGIKSGETRRRNKRMQQEMKIFMEEFEKLQSKDEARAKQVIENLVKLYKTIF